MIVYEARKCKCGNCYKKRLMVSSLQTLAAIFLPGRIALTTKNIIKVNLGLFNEEIRCTERLCLCSRTYCCDETLSNMLNFSVEGLNKRTFKDNGDGPRAKCRKALVEAKLSFLPIVDFEQTTIVWRPISSQRRDSIFFRQAFEADGNHTVLLQI